MKAEIGAYSCPQGSKIGYQRDFQVLRAYLRPIRAQMGLDFYFYALFRAVTKIKAEFCKYLD